MHSISLLWTSAGEPLAIAVVSSKYVLSDTCGCLSVNACMLSAKYAFVSTLLYLHTAKMLLTIGLGTLVNPAH